MKILKLSIFIVSLFANSAFSQNYNTVNLSESSATKLELNEVSYDYIRLKSKVEELRIHTKSINQSDYSIIEIDGMILPSNVGRASLPVFSELIEVPHDAEVEIIINHYDEEIINLNDLGLNKIFPTQPSYSKSATPEEIVFVKDNDYYTINSYEEEDIVNVEVYGIMRGVQIGRLEVRPYHYNPVENTLKIYNNLDFEIRFNGADIAKTEEMKSKFFMQQFQGGFLNKLINYNTPAAKDALSDYSAPIKYVIVANRAFETTLQPFVEWKTMKGFNVIEAYTDEIGGTNTQIKNYLQDMYDNATPEDPAPLYLLIIGDHSGNYSIPAFASTATTPSSNHVTDLYFVCFDGPNDYFPDMYYGRISATTTQQLQNALDKIIPYEMYTMPSGDYLDRIMLIAGTDNNFASSHGDATIYYAIDNYYNTAAGYQDIYAYYYSMADGPYHTMYTQNNSANASPSVRSRFTEGVGFANYTAHCNWDRWGDPSVLNSHIPDFNNKDEYPFMIGNCCQSMRFNQNDAFGEILLYTQDAGAVGYIGASNNSYWNEDVYWGIGLTSIAITTGNAKNHTYQNTGLGVYDAIWHTHGEPYEDWYYSGSQINFRGNMEVQASTSTYKKYYWEIYHLSGDPSLVPYNSKPDPIIMTFSNPMIGATSLIVNTEPYAYIAISQNGELLDAQWSADGTTVTLEFDALSADPVNIVGTKQDRAPSINTDINPIAPEPPIADFEADQTVIFQGESVSFTDLSENPTTWQWSFGDGETSEEQNPLHIYNETGVFTVSLYVTNMLGEDTKTIEDYITVNPSPPIADFQSNVQETCDGLVTFQNLSSFSDSWLWNFGDGNSSIEQNPVHIYSENGTYIVTLTAYSDEGEHTFIAEDYITVELPESPETTGAEACGESELTLFASGEGILQWYDQPQYGELIHTGTEYTNVFNQTTSFYVNSLVKPIVFGAKNEPTDGLEGGYFEANFRHGLVFNASENVVLKSAYMYSNEAKERHIVLEDSEGNVLDETTVFIDEGEHRVTLNLNIPQGSGMILYGPVEPNLYREGETGTTWNPADPLPYPYHVDDLIQITQSTAGGYELNFYYYFYDWEVEATIECVSARTPVTATIHPEIQVDLGDDIEYCGQSVTLDAGEGFTSYSWNGNLGIQTFEVTESGIYTVEVTDENNCTATDEINIDIYPEINITTESTPESSVGAADGTATVNISGGTPDFIISWDTEENTQTVTGLEGGTYHVTVTDDNGCFDTDYVIVNTEATPPIAGFHADVFSGCDELTVNFTDVSSNSPDTWLWDFGDGNTSEQQNPTHTYNSTGVYTVSLIVTNDFGTDTYEIADYISVGETPQISLSMTEESYPEAEDGTATVSVTFAGSYSVEWNNGETTEMITNLEAGIYCVTVADIVSGCEIFECVEVTQGTIDPGNEPIANFSADETYGCNNLTVQFTDLSENNPTSWIWEFGDGYGSSLQNPVYIYENPGIYNVKLTVTNEFGTDVKIIENLITIGLEPEFSIIITHASGEGVGDGSASLDITNVIEPYTILWSTDETSEAIEFLTPGFYSVFVTGAYGCKTLKAFEIEWSTYSDIEEYYYAVFPNPTNNYIIVESNNQSVNRVEIYDLLGKVHYSGKIESQKQRINVDYLSSGIYFIKIFGDSHKHIEKLIIK